MSCGAQLLIVLSVFPLFCSRRMWGVKLVPVKMTRELHNIFRKKEDDKKVV